MAEWCRRCGIEVWAYGLMPNHVHLIAVPSSEDGLRLGVGEAHRRYTRRVSFRERWPGHLWPGRFASFVLDDDYLLAATRYVEMNPVRAGLVDRAEAYRWSSAAAHLAGRDDLLVKARHCSKSWATGGHSCLSPLPKRPGRNFNATSGRGVRWETRASWPSLRACSTAF